MTAAMAFAACKKDKTTTDPLTTGTWKAVAYMGSAQETPITAGPSLTFSSNGTYQSAYESNPGGTSTGTWKRATSWPSDIPEGVLVLETKQEGASSVQLILITFLNKNEIIVRYYISPELRPVVSTVPPVKFRRG
ncbi:hypothetical protein EGT74_11160 [Chitinophaga lutea]|uniref:Lipocalin-like domain-containing protein n=2 Tax=Chitinophaga lutea TaxID=2488634 RepID=A0A3N4QDJ9_9BACT|nr:hypothetical protein EGT74_11160 [Chitinophaga lutea]